MHGTEHVLPWLYYETVQEMVLEPIANAKSQGKEAFANGDYGNAVDCYTRVYP